MRDLNPYDHLQRFFRVCVVHFKQNIQPLKHALPHNIIEAMYSILSTEPHVNFEATLAKICGGGPKAKGTWYINFINNQVLNGISLAKGKGNFEVHDTRPLLTPQPYPSMYMEGIPINNKWE